MVPGALSHLRDASLVGDTVMTGNFALDCDPCASGHIINLEM
jgi:hypothetical protein